MPTRKYTKIYSNLLKKDIDSEKVGKIYIIKHNQLEAIASEYQFQYDMHVIAAEKAHAVVTCNMSVCGQDFSTIGESTSNTLWNDGDEDYPVTIAWARAFDRAVIKALDFDGPQVFSNKEINKKKLMSDNKSSAVCEENTSCDTPVESSFLIPDIPVLEPEEDEQIYDVCIQPVEAVKKKEKRTEVDRKTETNANHDSATGEPKAVRRDMQDDIILFGEWKGLRLKEVSNTKAFRKYMRYLKREGVTFPDKDRQKQMEEFIELYA